MVSDGMTLSVLSKIGVAVVWLALVGGSAEVLRRSPFCQPEMVRKVIHIGAGNVILIAWWLQIPAWVVVTASILFGTITLLSYRYPVIPGLDSVGRKSFGTFFYAISIGLLGVAFWSLQVPEYAVIGILIMTWGDGLAALVGQRFGAHPYQLWGMTKSWEGSLTMAVVSYGVCALVLLGVQGNLWQTWVVASVVATVAAGLEAFSRLGIDNLTVPIGAAVLCYEMNQVLLRSL
ncbi:MAG: diacylglycerol/polyprenol kinase family protein [Cyanobacteria bacterium P01_A01_bin.123]